MILYILYINKNEIRYSKNEKWKISPLFQKTKEQFDVLNGEEYDQSFCFSLERIWKGSIRSDVNILRGMILETNFRRE